MLDNPKYDSLNGWREEVGIKNYKGEVKHYEGGCEYDPTAEAIMAYMREQEAKNKQKELRLFLRQWYCCSLASV